MSLSITSLDHTCPKGAAVDKLLLIQRIIAEILWYCSFVSHNTILTTRGNFVRSLYFDFNYRTVSFIIYNRVLHFLSKVFPYLNIFNELGCRSVNLANSCHESNINDAKPSMLMRYFFILHQQARFTYHNKVITTRAVYDFCECMTYSFPVRVSALYYLSM